MTKIAAKRLDQEIERIFRSHCSGIQISIWDLGKVFASGRKAHAEGTDMIQAIVSTVHSLRKDSPIA